VYGISVAAQLAGTGPQNLRAYEARGLLHPDRTEGGTRRYSANDIERLRRIGGLLESGLNLAGIAMVMHLQDENNQLRAEREAQQWQANQADPSIPPIPSRKRTSSNSRPGSTLP
jgi:DNA-binding transcriptional MerR regulator